MAIYRKRGRTWQYRIRYRHPATGKRTEKVGSGFKRKADCIIAAESMEKRIRGGYFNENEQVLFIDYALKWLKDYAANNKVSTVRPRRIEYNRLVKQFGYVPIKKISSIAYQDYLNELNNKYATNTISGTHSTARMIFKRAYQDNIIDRDPTLYAKLPKKRETAESVAERINNKISKNMQVDEVKIFLSKAKEEGLKNDFEMFSLLANTGIRVGELCALLLTDVLIIDDLHYIRITKTLYNLSNRMYEYQLLAPKTSGSIRDVEISKELYQLMKKQLRSQKEQYLALEEKFENQFLFSRENGLPQIPKQIANRMRRLLKRANLEERYSPHTFRHTYASILEENNVPQVYIQKQLGHSSFNTTKETYIHLTDNLKREGSEKILSISRDLSI